MTKPGEVFLGYRFVNGEKIPITAPAGSTAADIPAADVPEWLDTSGRDVSAAPILTNWERKGWA
jgi:hypothetical protein